MPLLTVLAWFGGCGSQPPPPPPLPPLPPATDSHPAAAQQTLRFPDQIEHGPLQHQKPFVVPDHVVVQTADAVRVEGTRLIIDTWVSNPEPTPTLIVVMPTGGSFPYGGDSPLSVRLSRSSLASVTYVGPTFPPEPPPLMEITLPARSQVLFTAEIDLSNYRYTGHPEVQLEWSFNYFSDSVPQGTLRATLP